MSITWTVWIARAGKQYRNECCQVQKQFQIKQSGKQHLRVLSNSNNEQCVSCGPTNSHLFILTCLSPFRFNQNILKARYTVRQTDRHTDRSTKRWPEDSTVYNNGTQKEAGNYRKSKRCGDKIDGEREDCFKPSKIGKILHVFKKLWGKTKKGNEWKLVKSKNIMDSIISRPSQKLTKTKKNPDL